MTHKVTHLHNTRRSVADSSVISPHIITLIANRFCRDVKHICRNMFEVVQAGNQWCHNTLTPSTLEKIKLDERVLRRSGPGVTLQRRREGALEGAVVLRCCCRDPGFA